MKPRVAGGYGLNEDYPVARGYRDSRNQRFEAPTKSTACSSFRCWMKPHVATLRRLAAGAKLQEEILSGAPMDDLSDGQVD